LLKVNSEINFWLKAKVSFNSDLATIAINRRRSLPDLVPRLEPGNENSGLLPLVANGARSQLKLTKIFKAKIFSICCNRFQLGSGNKFPGFYFKAPGASCKLNNNLLDL
jgi:hypothetical protein